MADIFLKTDNNAIRVSVEEVIRNIDKDLIEIRNKLPKTVGERLLMLSRDLVPVYTGTLIESGKVEKGKYDEGVVLVYDATVGQQEAAQKQMFGKVWHFKKGQKDNESYAEDVEARTQFMSKAIDIYNHNSKMQYKFSNMDEEITINVPVDIPLSLRHDDYIPLRHRYNAERANKIIESQERTYQTYYAKNKYSTASKRYRYNIEKRRKHYKKLYGANLIK